MPAPVPEYDQFVQYVVEGDTPGSEPVVRFVPPHQLSLDTLLVLESLKEGYERAAARGHVMTLQTAEIDALQAAASEVYHTDVVEHEVVSSNPAAVIEALIAVRSRPEWHVGLVCEAADLERARGVYFSPEDGNLYVCIQPHTAQPDWRPDLPGLGALWLRFYEPESGPQPWVQPTGTHDAYNIGDRVLFDGSVYESLIDANVWSPAVYPAGWKLIS